MKNTILPFTGTQLIELLNTLTTEQLEQPVWTHIQNHIHPDLLESNWHYENDKLVLNDPELSYFSPQAH